MEDDPKKPTPPTKLEEFNHVASLVITAVALLCVYVFGFLAATGAGGVFDDTIAQVSDDYFTQVK
jgi:hypothetical protein